MKISNNFTTSIHVVLRDLIDEKSKRDQIKFTSAQLANALCMPRSMIAKLTHADELKRVINPRIDTLLKIIEFFRADGFDITIDNLLGLTKKTIDVQDQKILLQNITKEILLYSSNAEANRILGTIEIKTGSRSKNIFALCMNEDVKPFFKKGSIFIIDQDQRPEDDNLVAISLKNSTETQIKKYHTENNKIILKSLDSTEKIIVMIPQSELIIIGVIIQVNAKT